MDEYYDPMTITPPTRSDAARLGNMLRRYARGGVMYGAGGMKAGFKARPRVVSDFARLTIDKPREAYWKAFSMRNADEGLKKSLRGFSGSKEPREIKLSDKVRESMAYSNTRDHRSPEQRYRYGDTEQDFMHALASSPTELQDEVVGNIIARDPIRADVMEIYGKFGEEYRMRGGPDTWGSHDNWHNSKFDTLDNEEHVKEYLKTLSDYNLAFKSDRSPSGWFYADGSVLDTININPLSDFAAADGYFRKWGAVPRYTTQMGFMGEAGYIVPYGGGFRNAYYPLDFESNPYATTPFTPEEIHNLYSTQRAYANYPGGHDPWEKVR